MRLAATIFALFTFLFVAQAAPTFAERSLHNRAIEENILDSIIHYEAYKSKRDIMPEELSKREYAVVTEILTSISDSGIVEEVLHAVATSETLEPIVINTLVTVLKSGLLNYTMLFQVLEESNLIETTVESLISDCTFYSSLFDVAKKYIGNLVGMLTGKIESAYSNKKREFNLEASYNKNVKRTVLTEMNFEKRDLHDIIVNILESVGASGLVPSLIKTILTDPVYIHFGVDLIKAIIENNAINFRTVLSAIKDSGLVSGLFEKLLNWNTAKTIATNAFAAFQGKCSGQGSATATIATTSTAATSNEYPIMATAQNSKATALSWTKATALTTEPIASTQTTGAIMPTKTNSIALVITANLPS